MKETGIIFNTEMVRAILDGRKTQTRRLNGLEQFNQQPDRWRLEGNIFALDGGFEYYDIPKCPYGQPGDRIWVRETWACEQYSNIDGEDGWRFETLRYKADANVKWNTGWRPSIHMPRWASRINLDITNIRINRVQEITYEDVCAEGIRLEGMPALGFRNEYKIKCIEKFKQLWDSIYLKRGFGWDKNDWVWVIDFRRAA